MKRVSFKFIAILSLWVLIGIFVLSSLKKKPQDPILVAESDEYTAHRLDPRTSKAKEAFSGQTSSATNRTESTNADGEATACRCSRFSVPEIYESELSKFVSWRNLSVRQMLERQHPNLPLALLSASNGTWCHLMPLPHEIEWHNTYYQKMRLFDNSSLLLYSAFLDNRRHTTTRPCVHILAYSSTLKPRLPWCQLWFNATGPPATSFVAKANGVFDINTWRRQRPFLFTCPVPRNEAFRKPLAVSLVWKRCEAATNLLQVVGEMTRDNSTALMRGASSDEEKGSPRWNVAVCGLALYYYHDDFSARIVEWLELLRAMGVARVFLSETRVHPNIKKVLRHYEDEGFVAVTKFAYPEPFVDEPNLRRVWTEMKRFNMFDVEKLYHTDCILRHMHEYRFIAHFDPDELPVLLNHTSLPLWLNDKVSRGRASSYRLSFRFHFNQHDPPKSSFPEYMYVLNHLHRPTERVAWPGFSVKSIHDMDYVTAVTSHISLICGTDRCPIQRSAQIPLDDAYLGHFKSCGPLCEGVKRMTKEPSLLRYKTQVLEATTRVLRTLGLI